MVKFVQKCCKLCDSLTSFDCHLNLNVFCCLFRAFFVKIVVQNSSKYVSIIDINTKNAEKNGEMDTLGQICLFLLLFKTEMYGLKVES